MTLDSLFRRFAFAPLPVPQDWFAIPLRLMVGYGFLEHGYAKLARGPDDFVAILHAMGMPFAFFLGWATIVIEVVGGLLILCGAFVPLASVPMIVVLLVATFTAHLPNGFSSIKLLSYDASGAHFGQPGYETDLLYIAALLALCFGGAGPLSLDGYVSARRTVDRRGETELAPGGQAARMARRAAPELAITTTIRNTPRTTDCQ
ncbi:MAG TPA: DoxX family protein [Roseiarcus sp.]